MTGYILHFSSAWTWITDIMDTRIYYCPTALCDYFFYMYISHLSDMKRMQLYHVGWWNCNWILKYSENYHLVFRYYPISFGLKKKTFVRVVFEANAQKNTTSVYRYIWIAHLLDMRKYIMKIWSVKTWHMVCCSVLLHTWNGRTTALTDHNVW